MHRPLQKGTCMYMPATASVTHHLIKDFVETGIHIAGGIACSLGMWDDEPYLGYSFVIIILSSRPDKGKRFNPPRGNIDILISLRHSTATIDGGIETGIETAGIV